MLGSYIALACGGLAASTGCDEPAAPASAPVSLQIRFHGPDAPAPSGVTPLALNLVTPDPVEFDDVARVLVDIYYDATNQPFYTNFELTEYTPNDWRGDMPLLPKDEALRFEARALDATGVVGFSGSTVATLTSNSQTVEIPLASVQNGETYEMPRMYRIIYPAAMYAGREEQIIFTIEGNAGAAIGVKITPAGDPTTPAAAFSPATGTVTLTNTVADFISLYTPPTVMVDADFDYQVTITTATTHSAVAITTNFRTKVKPVPPSGQVVVNTEPTVLFSPVILSLTANGSSTPGAVELVAAVSDDSAPAQLTYQWGFAPTPSTPAATFANNGQTNPTVFEGYTVDHEGAITLAVTDEDGGTTTLLYTLTPDQFADAIDHDSVNGLKQIVSGEAHTCVLTGQGRVRCWGDNQYGQLGYGNAIDVGDHPSRLPYHAGDVNLLPASDPVMQLVAGSHHTCALMQSGWVYCWGRNHRGQLGYNRTDNLADGEAVTTFGYVTLGDLATRIAAGGDHTCAVLQSGALRCWGRNDYGQLGRGNTAHIGDNETVYSAGNVDLGAGVTVKDLALGVHHTCALLATGAVRCWGLNGYGQLGYGNNANIGDNEPINNLSDVSLTGTVRKVVAGGYHTCALTEAGTLRCWGYGVNGELGQSFSGGSSWGDAANELPSTLPSDINVGSQVTDVTTGDHHVCALSSNGRLKCWGWGTSGQLGYGNTVSQSTPPATGVNLDGVSAYRITAGAAHTCALRSNGTARCWGAGGAGRLGRGSTTSSSTATGNVNVQIFAP